MEFRGNRLASVLLAFLLFAVSFGAHAVARGATLVVNDLPVLRLSARQGPLSAAARVLRIARLLESMGGSIRIAAVGPRIYARGKPILTVTAGDCAGTGMTRKGLAKAWARRLQEANDTTIKLGLTSLRMAGGTSKTVPVYGSRASAAIFESSDEQVARVQKVAGGILVTSYSAGNATITASLNGGVKSIAVEVRAYAAVFPQQVSVEVTGAPATTETVRGAIENAIHNGLVTALGADVKLIHVEAAPVYSGGSQVFAARVTAYGMDSLTNEGQVFVNVRNVALPQSEESELWYCNDPESVKGFGPLFSASLQSEQPVRLLYHHMNASRKPMYIKVQAVNDSDVPARMMIIPGDSKPDFNPVQAGLRAADEFVRGWRCGSGEIVTIPPHCSLPISLRRLKPDETMSGLCTLRLLAGGPDSMLVRADAREPFAVDGRWSQALHSDAPWRIVGSQHIREFDAPARTLTEQIYPHPYKTLSASYVVGGRFAFVRIGQSPIERQDKKDSLDGNFGVVYNVHVSLSNPTPNPAEVELVFESSAGYAGAVFILNGELIQTPLLRPKAERRLMKIRLEPNATRQILLTTIPLSGGSYPATITIRPLGSSARYGTTPLADRA